MEDGVVQDKVDITDTVTPSVWCLPRGELIYIMVMILLQMPTLSYNYF